MNDEKYVYVSDVKEKKITARSARKQRTHCGKGGAVRFPSDYLSKKELNAMNGEVKSYRINEPMNWSDFRAMPDDLKVMYIKWLREKFNAPGRQISKMMGTDAGNFAREIRRLGIAEGAHSRTRNTQWDKEGFFAWAYSGKIPAPVVKTPALVVEEADEGVALEQEEAEEIVESTSAVVPIVEVDEMRKEPIRVSTTPISGNMVFECPANQALEMMAQVLGNAKVLIRINWEVLPCEVGES